MKTVLMSLLAVALIGGLVGGGLFAYFSDTETSTGNTFEAGVIDLKIYNPWPQGQGSWIDNPPAITELDKMFPNAVYEMDCTDIKPCHEGKIQLNVKNAGINPGTLDITFANLVSNENACTEPEALVDGTCGDPGPGEGELCDNLMVQVWFTKDGGVADDGDGGWTAPDADDELVIDWTSLSDLAAAGATRLGNMPENSGEKTIHILVKLPCDTGNICQSDSCIVDVIFSLMQIIPGP